MKGKGATECRVGDVMQIMERLAPLHLAEEWDNCGLQVGSAHWPVRKIWIALDPLPEVVCTAAEQQVDLLMTHHPLIFKPLRTIDAQTPVGGLIERALSARMAIYSAHTNLDSAREGVNTILARTLGLKKLTPLVPYTAENLAPDKAVRLGLGRLGSLDRATTLSALIGRIKKRMHLLTVKVAGDLRLEVRRAAVCSGSGSSLIEAFLDSDAQVYISGDLHYHAARTVVEAGRALIDVGHFASEHLVTDALSTQLGAAIKNSGWDVVVEPCRLERDPFMLR
jgi:dinuclear metal center YbgI/SA1388 family protein